MKLLRVNLIKSHSQYRYTRILNISETSTIVPVIYVSYCSSTPKYEGVQDAPIKTIP